MSGVRELPESRTAMSELSAAGIRYVEDSLEINPGTHFKAAAILTPIGLFEGIEEIRKVIAIISHLRGRKRFGDILRRSGE